MPPSGYFYLAFNDENTFPGSDDSRESVQNSAGICEITDSPD